MIGKHVHAPEYGSQENADIANVNWNVERVQNFVDGSRCDHQPGIDLEEKVMINIQRESMKDRCAYSATNDAAQRIPGSLVKPVEEVIEAMLNHMMSGAVVEPVTKQKKNTRDSVGFHYSERNHSCICSTNSR
jgi:hypothetical protein